MRQGKGHKKGHKKKILFAILAIIAVCIVYSAKGEEGVSISETPSVTTQAIADRDESKDNTEPTQLKEENDEEQKNNSQKEASSDETTVVPVYSGQPYVELNNDLPEFTFEEKKSTDSFENYSDLDQLGRCGVAFANICEEIQPTEERQDIGMIKPSGWHTVKYNDLIEGNYLYNRCHLIAHQLAGENANEKNLITGTRYLNVGSMLDYENKVADYVEQTKNHVLFRVTPIYDGDNLVATGVQMEAWSVEDGGNGICFNVFCYNVQPGIVIDYSNGESYRANATAEEQDVSTMDRGVSNQDESTDSIIDSTKEQYVVNTNTKKFHLPTCQSAKDTLEHNKKVLEGTVQDMKDLGYTPCQRCLKEYKDN